MDWNPPGPGISPCDLPLRGFPPAPPNPGMRRLFAASKHRNIAVFFVYALRRVDCPKCGVTVESVPWAEGKEHLTTTYRWFLARWAKRLSWKETAVAFNTTWDNVFRAVKHAVLWGLAHRDLSGIEAIGVDEIQWRSGHTYLTLVYQISGAKRLLWVSHERTEQSLRRFFEILIDDVKAGIEFVCSDMWKPYLKVIAEQIPAAIHVLDRLHIMRNLVRMGSTCHKASLLRGIQSSIA